jgi:endonuclease YncB( thermonuclease family)
MTRTAPSTQQRGTKCPPSEPLWIGAVLCYLVLSPLMTAHAQATEVRVVRVVDGDTVVVADAQSLNLKVRLHAIDAPECGMPFGPQAQAFLEKLILGRTVQMEAKGRDRYHRTVATLAVDDLDVGLAMLQAGLAWHDRRSDLPRLPEANSHYAEAQRGASLKLAGLWAGSERMAPWLWRSGAHQPRGKRHCCGRFIQETHP